MILLVGGTGTLGRELATRLTASGREVRVLTRDPGHADGLSVDVAVGDLRDRSSLARAMRGTSVVVSAAHGFLGGRGAGPEEIDRQGNLDLIRTALDAGVEHFVLMSVLDARSDHPMSLHRAKFAAEQHLRASGLPWTVLRPAAYVETWIAIVGGALPSGRPAIVLGGADNPISFVSVHDVAALAERSLTDASLRGHVIDIPGVDNLTLTQLAEHLGAAEVRHVPLLALRFLSTALAPWAPARARQARAAVVMDTEDMTGDATALRNRFPMITWHPATHVAHQFHAAYDPTG